MARRFEDRVEDPEEEEEEKEESKKEGEGDENLKDAEDEDFADEEEAPAKGSEEDEDIYSEDDRDKQMEEDEISPAEAGFVEGYEKLRFAKCKQCEKSVDFSKAFELELMGNDYLFCSEECAERFEENFLANKKRK